MNETRVAIKKRFGCFEFAKKKVTLKLVPGGEVSKSKVGPMVGPLFPVKGSRRDGLPRPFLGQLLIS
jgi:hypothetical protein